MPTSRVAHVHLVISWRVRVGDVGGFLIRTGPVGGITAILNVDNLVKSAVENSDTLIAEGHTHFFVLLPEEFVAQVDVYSKPKAQHSTHAVFDQINGLRFHTNKRVSEWFGPCNGTETCLTSSDEYFIRASYGSVHSHGCGQVGVVYAPLATKLHHRRCRLLFEGDRIGTSS